MRLDLSVSQLSGNDASPIIAPVTATLSRLANRISYYSPVICVTSRTPLSKIAAGDIAGLLAFKSNLALRDCSVSRVRDWKTGLRMVASSGYFLETTPRTVGAGSYTGCAPWGSSSTTRFRAVNEPSVRRPWRHSPHQCPRRRPSRSGPYSLLIA